MMLRYITIIVTILLSGCASILPPYHLTEVAFVRVYNNTSDNLTYKAHMYSQWTEVITVESNNVDFLFEYDRKTINESLPGQLHQITLFFKDCTLELNRMMLEAHMQQPDDKSAGWNLYVSQGLIDSIGCKK